MAMRVLYLDVDDEITSAAARIRSAEEIRIAIVLPYGSRVATSRINFRLLARDATTNGKRLTVVAVDAATRALAASAGLPVFASVAEYEAALEAERVRPDAEAGADAGAGIATAGPPAPTAAPPPPGPVDGPPTPTVEPPSGTTTGIRRRRSSPARKDDTARTEAPGLFDGDVAATATAATTAAAAPATAAPPAATAAGPGTVPAESAPVAAANVRGGRAGSIRGGPARGSMAHPIERAPVAVSAERVVADSPHEAGSRIAPAAPARSFGGAFARTPILIGAAVLALALVVGSVGAYLLLPTATVVITPRQSAIGPIEVRVVASASATASDPATRTVPAQTLSVDAQASGTFNVTGTRVEETAARGTVRFENNDTGGSHTIAKGSIVGTRAGARFRTDASVTLEPATFVGGFKPSHASVRVTATNPGPEGNVGANEIVLVPADQNPILINVTNPDPTTGGKRQEFPRVVQADLDAATKALRGQVRQDFDTKVADPALADAGSTVFAETASLGQITFSVDPKTLLGKEVATFDLGASASGTVLAVDGASVTEVAGSDIASRVDAGYRLVDGSSEVNASPGEVTDGQISFPVTIAAREVLIVDPATVEAEIRGMPLADARTALARYGQADLTVWPDWVGSIPTLDMRVDVRVQEAVP
jgi:hypothetical protein